MESCDVIIVGGGPAGSTCAWSLHAAGLDVVVLDRASFPRDKPCAGWITPPVLDELRLDVEEYRAGGRVFQPIFGFRTSRMGSGEVVTRYDRPVSYGILRCEFDTYLLNRSGARLRLGEPLRELRRAGSGWIVNERLEAPLLISAGGHFCPVSRWLGRRPGLLEHPVTAKEIEVRLDDSAKSNCQVDPELPALFFCRDLIGYGWCFRKGDHLNIGLGRLVPQDLAEHLAQFHTMLVSREIIPPATPTHYHGHAYLVRSVSDRDPVADGVLLVGDAAGLAYPESGEGIRPAIESALLAAQIVTTAGGRYGRDDLEPYRRALESRFGPSGERQPGFTGKPSWLHAGIGGFLLGIPWFARRVVMENWFLHAHQRPLSLGTEPGGMEALRSTDESAGTVRSTP